MPLREQEAGYESKESWSRGGGAWEAEAESASSSPCRHGLGDGRGEASEARDGWAVGDSGRHADAFVEFAVQGGLKDRRGQTSHMIPRESLCSLCCAVKSMEPPRVPLAGLPPCRLHCH